MSGGTGSQVDIGDAEPGSCQESMLITTDSIEEFSQEISTSLVEEEDGSGANDQQNGHVQTQPSEEKVVESGSAGGNITKIQDGLNGGGDKDGGGSDGAMSKSSSFSSAKSRDLTASCTSLAGVEEGTSSTTTTATTVATSSGQQAPQDASGVDLEDYLHDPKFLNKKRHVFILSSAGKPIYSMHFFHHNRATILPSQCQRMTRPRVVLTFQIYHGDHCANTVRGQNSTGRP